MPKRTTLTTQEYLRNALLPAATATYTVIPHGVIIDKTHEILAARGFVVEREIYRCNEGATVAQGVYHLKYGDAVDPDMGILFAWTNSYDKSVRFKCCIGGYVHSSLASVISSSFGSWGRKHTGTADTEANDTILSQIENADEFFKAILADKEAMMKIKITPEQRAEAMGHLYFEHEALTGEQMGLIRDEFNEPSFKYNGEPDSVWCMYNAIIYSLQKAHPKTWMDQQRAMHWFICEHFNIQMSVFNKAEQNKDTAETPSSDPNQLDIITEINKVEKENGLISETSEGIQEPVQDVEEKVEEPIFPITEETFSLDEKPTKIPEENTEEKSFVIQDENKEPSFILEAEEKTVVTETSNVIAVQPENSISTENIDDSSWPCLECGELQGPEAIFCEGQLCTKCNDKK